MNKVLRGLCVASLLIAVIPACKKKGAEGDDAAAGDAAVAVDPDAAAATPPPAAPAAASNEADVARFPDEAKLDNVAATLARFTNAREVPVSGKIVAQLNKGVAVTEIASRTNASVFLVTFDSPKEPGKRLMGWIPAESFIAAPVVEAGLKVPNCVAPEVVVSNDTLFCAKICTADTECPAGQACRGVAGRVKDGKPVNDQVRVCVIFNTPTAATSTVAQRVPGVTPPPPPPPPPPAIVGDVAAPQGGSCPVDFALVRADNQCHKRCKGSGCAAGNICTKCGGVQVCASPILCK